MTLETLVLAALSYVMAGGLVTLWLWPVRHGDDLGDEVVRALILLAWPAALATAALFLLAEGVRRALVAIAAREWE